MYINLKLTLISHFWPENFGLEIIAHHIFTQQCRTLLLNYHIRKEEYRTNDYEFSVDILVKSKQNKNDIT